MSSRLLYPLLGLCAIVGLWPPLMWVSARYLDRIDDRWMDSLSATGVTLPVGLGLAALVLVAHGLRRNTRFREEMEADAEERFKLTALQMAPTAAVAAPAAGPRTASVSASRSAAAAPAVAEAPPEAGKKGGGMGASKDKALKRGKSRGKSLAKREVRKSFRDLRR